MITAIVMIDAATDAIPEVAAAIADLEGVSEVYSTAGEVDLIAIVRVREFDQVAEVIVEVLRNTEAGTTKAGGPSKASYVLADGVADRVKAASAEMLDKHPLYPGLTLA